MNHRLPVSIVLMTLLIDSMGFAIIMPVMPDLLKEVAQSSLGEAALWGGVLSTSFAVMQFTFSPTIGNLSDRYGRRPILLLSLGVLTVDYLIMGLAHTIWLLLLARVIGGICAATNSTASAYISDISPPEKKAQNFGLVGAAFGVGFVLGPMVGGLLAEYGTRVPFYFAAGLAAANLLLGFVALPETVTDDIRRPFDWKRANPLGAIRQIQKFAGLSRLLWVYFIHSIAFFVYPATWAFYAREQFGWGAFEVGTSLMAFGLAMFLVQGFLIRLIVPKLGEHRTVILGLSVNLVMFALYAVIRIDWLIYALLPISALGMLANPAIQGIMARMVGDDQQGELQGIFSSVGAVALIISPALMTSSFWLFTQEGASFQFPGAPFAVAAILTALELWVFMGRERLGGKSLGSA